MDRKVEWTEIASLDLQQAFEYIARDSENYARTFVRRALRAAHDAALFPLAGRQVPEFGNPSIRETYVYSYRLIYSVRDDAISIIALIHGARDLGKAWRDEDRPPP